MNESIVFYRSFYEAVKKLSVEDRDQAIMALLQYGLDGVEPSDISTIAEVVYTMAKPQLDANQERKENGKKGGRPSKKTIGFENENHRLSDEKPNVNVKVNENVNDKEKEKESAPERTPEKSTTELLGKSSLSDISKQAVNDWLAYKKERREPYKPAGFKALLTKMEKLEKTIGPSGVKESIEASMANGYKGIFPAKTKTGDSPPKNKFNNFTEREYDYDRLEASLLGRRRE